MIIEYAKQRKNVNPDDCRFYHAMDIPGLGEVGREWDLRENIEQYLGNFDFKGKRTLDVGTASGYLTFEMEKRGANMVSFDMQSARHWNVVPHHDLVGKMDALYDDIAIGYRKLQNAYWYAHGAFKSKAKAFYGDVYNIPEELGEFDVVFFGMILSHLRDPFQALYSASRLSADTVIITNQSRAGGEHPDIWFLPTKENKINRAWWSFSDNAIEQMLEVLGFKVVKRTMDEYKHLLPTVGREQCTTFVAKRI